MPFADLSNSVPVLKTWQVKDVYNKAPTPDVAAGDGGNLENFGILQLLARQVKDIVLCIPTNGPLKYQKPIAVKGKKIKKQLGIDGFIPPLFGMYGDMEMVNIQGAPTTQVFPMELFDSVFQGLVAQKKQGGAIFYKATLPVVDNEKFNISSKQPDGSPYTINLYIYYTEVSPKFEKQLPTQIQADIKASRGNEDPVKGRFPNFPMYATMGPKFNISDPTTLNEFQRYTAEQANLLADFVYWGFNENMDEIKGIFKK